MGSLEKFSRQALIDKVNELQVLLEIICKENDNQEHINFPWIANLGHWYWHVKTNKVVFNEAKIRALGYARAEVPAEIGYEFFTEKIHPDDYARVMDNLRNHLSGISPAYETSYRIKTKNNHWAWFYDRGKVTKRDAHGKPELVSGIAFDISEQKRMEEQLEAKNRRLEELSMKDYLTDLFNRRALIEKLDFEIKRSMRRNSPFSVLMLDLDHFKLVNDTHGHQIGDKILIQLADLFKKSVREIDIVGRYGGEEFLIILPDCELNEAVKVAERIRSAVEAFEFESHIHMTISGGVAEYHTGSIEDLIAAADQYLYEAKESGRNRIEYLPGE